MQYFIKNVNSTTHNTPHVAPAVSYNTTMYIHTRYTRGAGMVEVVVGSALIALIFTGLFGVLQLGTRLATDNKLRTGAVALALERMEYIRSLDYDSIGTVGGDPSGALVVNESIAINGVTYNRRTYIVYVDDAADGLGGSDSNSITDDYKRVKVEVSWDGQATAREVALVTDITPVGVEE